MIGRYRYGAARILRKIANRISPRHGTGIDFPDIGADRLPKNAPRALVIYVAAGIDHWLRGVPLTDPFFNKHSMYWESVEMVKQLNAHGYVVDYADKRNPVAADWSRYALIMDQWDNLHNIPNLPGQVKVHYTTYMHWLPNNTGENTRIQWFKNRTGMVVPSARWLPPISSDQFAQYLTHFGTGTRDTTFDVRPTKYRLNVSVSHTPTYHPKDIEASRKNFLWLGGGGAVHKGLDLVMEAFSRMPDMNLFIVGGLQNEPIFMQWAESFITQYPNIRTLGWMDISSRDFDAIARQCIGAPFLSAAEGGPGSVAQLLHWGLIPIVTPSSNVQGEAVGFMVNGGTDEQLISGMVAAARELTGESIGKLKERSHAATESARTSHTRGAYANGVSKLFDVVCTKNN